MRKLACRIDNFCIGIFILCSMYGVQCTRIVLIRSRFAPTKWCIMCSVHWSDSLTVVQLSNLQYFYHPHGVCLSALQTAVCSVQCMALYKVCSIVQLIENCEGMKAKAEEWNRLIDFNGIHPTFNGWLIFFRSLTHTENVNNTHIARTQRMFLRRGRENQKETEEKKTL